MTRPIPPGRLRRAAPLAGLALLLHAAPALAGDTVGIGLGSSTLSSGVSAKWHGKSGSGLQLVVGPWGTGFDGGGTLALNLDGIRDMPKIGSLGPIDVGWSLGGGAGVALASTPVVAAAGVAGLNFKLQPVPLELALELRPRLVILPEIYGDLLNASGHLRWWF